MRQRLAGLALVVLGLLSPGLISPGRALADVGFGGPSFSGAGAPTGQKPQSKLWVVGSTWFGSLYNSVTGKFEIHELNRSTHVWSSTGTVIDERDDSTADTLWDGSHLYVASAGPSTSTSDGARIMRFSYDDRSKTFSLDSGFPVSVSTGGMQAVVIDKDTTGKLWATFTQNNQVYVTHSTSADTSWTAPFVIPVSGATSLGGSDGNISSIVSYNDKIGVMWSNQNQDAMHFAYHRDPDPDSAWTLNTAIQQAGYADDHINLKGLDGDAAGQVFAATKTSLNDVGSSGPLILLMVLGNDDVWRRYTWGQVSDNHTRPILQIDHSNRRIYEFAAAPCCSGGIVYYKQTSLDSPSFSAGLGTQFLQSSTDITINNPTGTKQELNGTTDLVVAAGDGHANNYWHNEIDLASAGVDDTPPQTTIDSGPSGVAPSSTATFSFSSNEAGSSFECSLDEASFSSCSSPKTYSGLADGAHTFSVRATDAAGNVDSTPAVRDWTVDTTEPHTSLTSPGPPSETASADAMFVFNSNETGSTFECSFDLEPFSACTSPVSYSNLLDGNHTFNVRATDPAGNTDLTPASHTWTIRGSGIRTLVLSPDADATVRAAEPRRNFGTTTTLAVDSSPQQAAYLRFNLQDLIGTVRSASLRLFALGDTADGPALYGSGTGWTETGITWGNRPARTSTVTDDRGAIAANRWVEYNVTSLVGGDGRASFELAPTSSDGFDANSREAAANRPALVVTVSSTIPPEGSLGPDSSRTENPTGAFAPPLVSDTTKPAVDELSLNPLAFRAEDLRGSRAGRPTDTIIRYRLSEDATVEFRIKKAARGRRAGRRCLRPRPRNRAHRRCTRYRRFKGVFVDQGKQGVNTLRFRGRLNKKKLSAGRYKLLAVPIDASGNRGEAVLAGFRILRAR